MARWNEELATSIISVPAFITLSKLKTLLDAIMRNRPPARKDEARSQRR
jgi:hypothetical protein